MRVERLFVENVGPLERIDLQLKPVTVLIGANEQGKSFLLGALGLLRFGTTRGIKVGDTGVLTRAGAKGWTVEATVSVNPEADPLILRRTRSAGPDGPTLDGAMGDARVWRALLDGRSFLTLKPAERRGLVADLLARDTEDLLEILREKGAQEEILDAVRDGNLKRAYRLAEEARRGLDRSLADNETIVRAGAEDPLVQTKGGTKPISTIERSTIEGALKAATTKWRDAVRLTEQAKAHEAAIADATEAKRELGEMGPAPTFTNAEAARLKELGDLIRRKQDEGANLAAEQRGVTEQATSARARLAKADSKCPACGQVLSEEARAKLQGSLAGYEAVLVKQGDGVRAIATALELLKKEKGELSDRLAMVEDEKATRQKLQARIDATAALAGVSEAPEPIEAMEQEVRRLEALREARVRYDGRAEAVAGARARVEDLRAKRDVAKDIENATVPDKIDDEGAALKAINDACATYAAEILAGPGAVRVDSTWEVIYADRRVELASDSAEMRVGLVLALALSRLSGVKCVFLDRLESLDDASRTRVVNLLGTLAAAGEIETAIVACVKNEKPPAAKMPPWLQRVWIENGRATPL